jgi:protein O-GlcNAc transferase
VAISPHAILTRAVRLHQTGQLTAAAALYGEVLEVDPRNANALHLLGILSREGGDHTRAAELYSEAIASDPNVAQFRLNRGVSLRALGRLNEALEDFRRAGQLDPKLAEAYHQEGNTLKQLGRFPEAISALRTAVQLAPALAPAWLNLGVASLEAHDNLEAIRAFREAITLEPTRPEAHNILGVALLAAGQTSSARLSFAEALRLNPNYAAAHDNLGRLGKSEGLLDDAILHFRAALAIRPEARSHSNLLLALNYTANFTPAEVLLEHRHWNQLYAAMLAPTGRATSQSPPSGRRLRIGYVSPDFTHHAVSYFFAPVLANHDRSKMEVFCYASVVTPDRITEHLQSLAEHWRDIARLDDETAAALICADEIDLLIDLAGHTAGNRLLLFARRPAPFQATWLGYPNTTGLDTIDYRLTDAVSDPQNETDAHYSEELVRLPATFSCYEPDLSAPLVNPLPAMAVGAVTFGSFNNFSKVSSEVIALWARLLRELPEARLLLKSRGLGDASVAERIRSAFASHGVAPERMILNGEELSVAEHLRLYHSVDIALDPFPYNGTTTTCEALWMGVPVVTLAGHTHAARVGTSLLTHLGLSEWIATSQENYVAVATAAASDPSRLANLRGTLRDRMRRSPLCDAVQFTRQLEDAFARMVGSNQV